MIHTERRFVKSFPQSLLVLFWTEKTLTFGDTGILALLTVAENAGLFPELSNILKSSLESAIWKIWNLQVTSPQLQWGHTQSTADCHRTKPREALTWPSGALHSTPPNPVLFMGNTQSFNVKLTASTWELFSKGKELTNSWREGELCRKKKSFAK